jgi:hypothetical protein
MQHPSAYPPRPLPLRVDPPVPRHVRILRHVAAVLLAAGLVAGIALLGWVAAIGLGKLGQVWLVPVALLIIGVCAAQLVRRHNL